jgi:dTDP-4-dehydrorhamnose reductase
MGMRLLITGWQGQVAQSLIEAGAKRKDVEALAVGRPALDLAKLPTILRTVADQRPDVVINTAAYTAVDKAETEPDAAHALNCEGARMIAETAAARGIPIIHLSTDYVFDGNKTTPYVETDATGPLGVYGRTKLAGEQAVAAANPRHIIVRTAWVHSPFGQNFTKTMLRLAGERTELRVVGDQVGTPTYALHLATALLDIAAAIVGTPADDRRYGIYHAAGSGETSWHGLATHIVAASGKANNVQVLPIATAAYPTPAKRPVNSRLDCSKLQTTFGLVLPPWQEGATDCVSRLTLS